MLKQNKIWHTNGAMISQKAALEAVTAEIDEALHLEKRAKVIFVSVMQLLWRI